MRLPHPTPRSQTRSTGAPGASRRRSRRWSLATTASGTAAVVLGGSLAAVLAPAARAADRGANGEVVFSHGNGQIAVLHNGTETVLPPTGASSPRFSPDGTRIAYAAGFHIWVMTANGTRAKAVPVTGNPYEGDPAWSPDATRLAYINGSDGQIYTTKVSGGTATQLTRTGGDVNDLEWSPDGTRIAYDGWDGATGDTQIFTVTVATGAVTRLTSGSCTSTQPDWSPDAAQIAFSTSCFDGSGNIGVMPAGGGAAYPVARYLEAGAGYPSWSPDGSEIVFSANEGMGSEQLWASAPSNQGDGVHPSATQLTNDPGQPYNTAPSWQPLHHPSVTAPPSVARGARASVTVGDFLSEQTVRLSLVDAKGVRYALGSARTALSGAFSHKVTIPAGAAAGTGTLTATGVGGLSATVHTTVT